MRVTDPRSPRTIRRLLLGSLAGILIASLAVAVGGMAYARPTYQVMNTSEYPPDGVYFRSTPDWNQTPRIVGLGVYAGDRVELLCWETGTNVPRRDGGSNKLWYQAKNVTRSKAPGGQDNQGWINAHFVNDGKGPDVTAPNVSKCSPSSTQGPGGDASPAASTVYYSPYTSPVMSPFWKKWATRNYAQYDASGSPSVVTDRYETWTGPAQCSTVNAQRGVTGATHALAGWSRGRLGPLYYLANASDAQKNQIDYILMIDPGNYNNDMEKGAGNNCDNSKLAPAGQRGGELLASWLETNPRARLVVLSGNDTTDSANPVNGHANAGIQNIYFNAIRDAQRRTGKDLRSRVMVCNYTIKHQEMFFGTKDRIGDRFTTCPAIKDKQVTKQATVQWNP